jgi:hypothetical protein
MRNIFLYWVGREYKLLKIFKDIIYKYSTVGDGYKVHLINHQNIKEYITDIPECFYDLCPAHQADFVRVNVVCDYGGIWLDLDTLLLDNIDSLFTILQIQDGFFITDHEGNIINGVFGSKRRTDLLILWKNIIRQRVNVKKPFKWNEIGSELLNVFYKLKKDLFSNYKIFKGNDTMYPVSYENCLEEYINKQYENYKNIEREFQPILILVNSVYKKIEDEEELLNEKIPLNYFVNKTLENILHSISY